MCDERTLGDAEDAERRTSGKGRITRRELAVAAAGASLAALLPRARAAQPVAGADVSVSTPDGEADCYFTHPEASTHPGVIVWPDILGLRPAFRAMGDRLAASGHAVLVVNPYYRRARAPVVSEGASFRDQATRAKVMPLARSLTPETNVTDAKAFVSFLDGQWSNRLVMTCQWSPVCSSQGAVAKSYRGTSSGRNAARGAPATTRRARPQTPTCFVVASRRMPDMPSRRRRASGRLWTR